MSNTGTSATKDAFGVSLEIMARLRGPEGCPWDREQTFDSIKRHTLEETYEVFDAIERRAWQDLKDELGDLLLQVLFYSQMADEAGYFGMEEVVEGLNAKLIRRHPHVFSGVEARDSTSVLRHWEEVKKQEKQARGSDAEASLLDEIPRSMPAMLEAEKLGSRARKVGFDWNDIDGVFAKVHEEIQELQSELSCSQPQKPAIQEEFGDLLFTLISVGRHLKLDSESALRGANAKFRTRFRQMEEFAGGAEALKRLSPEELEQIWSRAKLSEERL